MPVDSPNRTVLFIVVFELYIKKKRGNLYLSLVPLIEAFALPITARTSNAEAHADMNNSSCL